MNCWPPWPASSAPTLLALVFLHSDSKLQSVRAEWAIIVSRVFWLASCIGVSEETGHEYGDLFKIGCLQL